MKKRLIALTLIFCTFSICAYAKPAEEPEAEVVVIPSSFSLQEAVEFAQANHSAVKTAQANVTKSDYQYQEAHNAYITSRSKTNEGYSTYETFLVKDGAYDQQALSGLNIAKASLNQTRENIKFGVETAYYKCINLKEKQTIAQNSYDSASEKLSQAKQQQAQGLAAPLEVMAAEIAEKRAAADLSKAERDVDSGMLELKNAIGVPLDTQFTLTTESIETPSLDEMPLADAVELAKAGNLNVIQAKEQLLSAEKTFSATKKWFTPNTYKFAQTNFAMVSAQETYQSAQNAAEVAVHKAYDTAVSTADNMDILVASIAYQEKNYEAMKQKYELGLIAKLDLDNSWYELQQNKMNLADYHYNCYLTVRQYQLSYTI